jgi:NTP pyrophosphatase (non-canonical NTP hydrolase)
VELSLSDAQVQVDDSIRSLGGYWPPLANLARLFEECGELARVINFLYGSKRRKEGEEDINVTEELGDVLYVLIALANSLEIDLESSLLQTIAKYERRDRAPTDRSDV